MAIDAFIKIDDLKGDSIDEKHTGEIEVLSWSWGLSQLGSTHSGTGGGSGKVSVQDLSITKRCDASTSNLIKMCCSGHHFKQALLTLRKAGGKTPVEYLKIKLQDIIVSSYSTGGSGEGGEIIHENISLNFAKVTVEYTPQDKTGAAQAAMSASCNIPGNTANVYGPSPSLSGYRARPLSRGELGPEGPRRNEEIRMTSAEESVRAGRLDDALAELQGQVRKKPAEARLRTFLFQLLAVRGEWDRALTQLKVAGDLDPTSISMVQTYQEAIRCELLRAEVFAGRRTPLLFGKPAEWMALVVQALNLSANGKFDEARTLRDKAFEGAPATSGQIDGQPFAWIADADPRLGPLLEAIVKGRYYWIPFSRLREIRVEKPTDLRDVAWLPANLALANGGETVALIPTRYPGSESAADSRVIMARSTEWIEHPGESFFGLGQRLLATDQGEYPLMDIRSVKLDSLDEAEAAAVDGVANGAEGSA